MLARGRPLEQGRVLTADPARGLLQLPARARLAQLARSHQCTAPQAVPLVSTAFQARTRYCLARHRQLTVLRVPLVSTPLFPALGQICALFVMRARGRRRVPTRV